MPRRTRKQLVGKIEDYEIDHRAEELADLERSLHRTWRWCSDTTVPRRDDMSRFAHRSAEATNFKEAG